MRRCASYGTAGFGLLVNLALAGCKAAAPPPAPAAAEFRPTATIREIMGNMIDPSADTLWESVATIVSQAGIEDRRPRTDDEWATVKRSAVTLVEATNLLLIDRPTGTKADISANPNIELSPAEIDVLRQKDPQLWKNFVKALYDASIPALNAINAKDADALLNSGEALDVACENCHLHYWYPPNKQPASIPSQKGTE
jgi:hypothetical protein